MPSQSRLLNAMSIRRVAFGSVTDTYANFGSALSSEVVQITFKNTTDKTIYISEDGTNDHYELPTNSYETIDLQTNARSGYWGVKKKGLQFKLKGDSGDLPTSGKVIMQGQEIP